MFGRFGVSEIQREKAGSSKSLSVLLPSVRLSLKNPSLVKGGTRDAETMLREVRRERMES